MGSKYVLGATWVAVGKDGSKDGSGRKADWGPTYRCCQQECSYLVGGARFKRVIK